MSRRAVALALVGSLLVAAAFLGAVWFMPDGSAIIPPVVTGVALIGVLLAAVGVRKVNVNLRQQVYGARERELQFRRRVDTLEQTFKERIDASDLRISRERAARESAESDLAALITASDEVHRRTASSHDVLRDRLSALEFATQDFESDVHGLEHGRRSQDVWAHGIESRLWADRKALKALETKTSTDRRRDHVRLAEIERTSYDHALRSGVELTSILSEDQARTLASRFSRESDHLRLKPLLGSFEVLDAVENKRLLSAFRTYRRYGYLPAQAQVASRLASVTEGELAAARLGLAVAESEFFRDPWASVPDLGSQDIALDSHGPVIHLVSKALPETQSGYTLRTHYTLRALQRRGVPAMVLCQAGAPGGRPDETIENVVEDVRYVMLPGIPRHETTYQQWLAENIRGAAEVVQAERPSVLHAHSDFLNALIATTVGRAFGIPVVYESRGFWEESWLSRAIATNDLAGTEEDFFLAYGLPEMYSWRQRAEITARGRSDANVTLGRTMREHIVALAGKGTLAGEAIRLVPNGIDPESFTAVTRDEELAALLGLRPGELVIGCISSIVEYEGIDVLLRAFLELRRAEGEDAQFSRLLIVGDGDRLESLKALATELGLSEAVVFTGRIPHAEVLRYYGLIDVFVIPRKPTRVSRLVTPLKPYEALASGRALVVSDVDALQEVAEDSGGAVELFPAGDHRALARLLSRLLEDPDRRQEMAALGSAWVRRERTWSANATVYEQVYDELGARWQQR